MEPLAGGLPGKGEELGGLTLCQRLDAVLRAPWGVACIAAKPEIPANEKYHRVNQQSIFQELISN